VGVNLTVTSAIEPYFSQPHASHHQPTGAEFNQSHQQNKCDKPMHCTPYPSVIQTTRHTLPMSLLCFAPIGCALLCPKLCFDSMAKQAGCLKVAPGVAQRLQLGELSNCPSKKGPVGWVHAAAPNRRCSCLGVSVSKSATLVCMMAKHMTGAEPDIQAHHEQPKQIKDCSPGISNCKACKQN